jgi:catechol 2,3-dioxygenase-like lactoylglutathione lyase family enzyme
MLNLPTPKLSDVNAFTIATHDLEKSLSFYQLLGFSELWRSDFPFSLIMISDGAIQIMLRQGEEPYIALTYYVREMDKVIAGLEADGINFLQKPKESDMIKRYMIQSPDGVIISLVTFVDGFTQPPGPTMLNTPPADFSNPEKYVNKTCGLFGEFAHPVDDLEKSISYWEKLGFKAHSQKTSPYPRAIHSY